MKKYRARPEDRRQVKEWKLELERLTRRQFDRDEAARQHQENMDRAAEKERQEEEARRAEAEAQEAVPINTNNQFVVRSVGISHLESGYKKQTTRLHNKFTGLVKSLR